MRFSTENSPLGKGSTEGICVVNYGSYYKQHVLMDATTTCWRIFSVYALTEPPCTVGADHCSLSVVAVFDATRGAFGLFGT